MLRPALLLLVPAAFAAVGAWAWLQGGRYEETENAYVKADLIVITPQVAGPVVEVPVREHQRVAAGDLLFRIDPAPYEAAVARAEADLAVARTELESLRAEHRLALVEAAGTGKRERIARDKGGAAVPHGGATKAEIGRALPHAHLARHWNQPSSAKADACVSRAVSHYAEKQSARLPLSAAPAHACDERWPTIG